MTTRALVMGVIDDADRSAEEIRREAERLAADGADLIELAGSDRVVLAASLTEVFDDLPQIVATDDVPTMAVSVVLGCRLIRTHDVRAARRVCDVLAAVQGATG